MREREREAHTNSNQENRMRQPAWSQHDPGTDLSCQNRKELVLRLPSMYGTALGNLHYCYAMHSRTQSHLSFFSVVFNPIFVSRQISSFCSSITKFTHIYKANKRNEKRKDTDENWRHFFLQNGGFKKSWRGWGIRKHQGFMWRRRHFPLLCVVFVYVCACVSCECNVRVHVFGLEQEAQHETR